MSYQNTKKIRPPIFFLQFLFFLPSCPAGTTGQKRGHSFLGGRKHSRQAGVAKCELTPHGKSGYVRYVEFFPDVVHWRTHTRRTYRSCLTHLLKRAFQAWMPLLSGTWYQGRQPHQMAKKVMEQVKPKHIVYYLVPKRS